MIKKRYRLYIDESGDHSYRQVDAPEKRYLGLIGCFFSLEQYPSFKEGLENLKREHFSYDPDFPLILHRKELVNRRGPFGRLLNPDIEKSFNQDLLNLLERSDFRIIAVVIDKKSHIERYKEAAFHPYHYCLACLLERYCGYLNFMNGVGDVLAESRGGREDKQLKEAFVRIYNGGTLWREANFFQRALTSKEIKLKPKSANIAGLQLADLLAHPIKQDMLVEEKRISDPGDVFGKKIHQAIVQKYNKHLYQGDIQGYGRIFLK